MYVLRIIFSSRDRFCHLEYKPPRKDIWSQDQFTVPVRWHIAFNSTRGVGRCLVVEYPLDQFTVPVRWHIAFNSTRGVGRCLVVEYPLDQFTVPVRWHIAFNSTRGVGRCLVVEYPQDQFTVPVRWHIAFNSTWSGTLLSGRVSTRSVYCSSKMTYCL